MSTALEQHYTVQYVALQWGMSDDKVREIFRDEPDVMRIGEGTRKHGRAYVRRYVSLRIPESAIIRVHNRLFKKK